MSLFAFLHGLLREHLAAVGPLEQPRKQVRNRRERKRTDWEKILPKVMDRLPQGTTVPQLRETLAAWHAGQQLSCNSVSADDPIACRLQSLESTEFHEVPPLTDEQQRYFDYIRDHGPKSGKEIVNALGGSESTLTRHIIPVLKRHRVRNQKGAGYYLAR